MQTEQVETAIAVTSGECLLLKVKYTRPCVIMLTLKLMNGINIKSANEVYAKHE